jgi:hypothetical protein
MKLIEWNKQKARIALETPDELVRGWDVHLGIEPAERPVEFSQAVQALPVEIEACAPKSATDGGGGFGVFKVETDYLRPYWELLKKRTGADPFTVDLLFAVGGIKHTHTVLSFTADETGIGRADVFGTSWPYIGEQLADENAYRIRGEKNSLKYLNESIGRTETEPQFIEVRGGLFKHNPKYGRGESPIVPALSNETLWQGLFSAWLNQFGTPEQKAVIARFARVHRSKEEFPSMRNPWEDAFHVDDYRDSFKWSDFQAMGKAVGV